MYVENRFSVRGSTENMVKMPLGENRTRRKAVPNALQHARFSPQYVSCFTGRSAQNLLSGLPVGPKDVLQAVDVRRLYPLHCPGHPARNIHKPDFPL